MSIFNAFIAYKFLKILSTPFEKTDAYKEGVIDKKGNQVVSRSDFNQDQKKSYTIFHHLIFKLKKIMHKVPVLKSRIGSFAAALWFIKETIKEEYSEKHAEMLEEAFIDHLRENGYDIESMIVNEAFNASDVIEPGVYVYENDTYTVARSIHAFDRCLGIPLFRLDENTVVTEEDITMKDYKTFKEQIANVAGSGQVAGIGNEPPMSKKSQKIHRRKTAGVTADNVKKESGVLGRPAGASIKLDEGRMKELHMLISQGKSAAQIAKIMKVDAKTIKVLMKDFKESVELGESSHLKKGDKVKWKGKTGTVVRYDKNGPQSPFYVVSFKGQYKSENIPAHKLKESVKLGEATKWKMGDGRPRGGSHIENIKFWDLPKDQLQYIIKDAGKAMKANPKARKATSGRGNWADQVNDAHTVLGWRKKNGIKESVELDEADNTTAVAKQVKQAVKKYTTGKLVVRSKGGKSRFIMVLAGNIDNKLRKMMLDIVAPKANVRDKSDISYGNISSNIISASVEHWVKALGLKESYLGEAKDYRVELEKRHIKALTIIRHIDKILGKQGKWTDSFGNYVTAKMPDDVDTSVDAGWEYQQNRGRGDWSFTIEPKDVVKYNYEGKAKIKKSGSMKIGEFTKFISKIWAKLNQKGLSSERPTGSWRNESAELDERHAPLPQATGFSLVFSYAGKDNKFVTKLTKIGGKVDKKKKEVRFEFGSAVARKNFKKKHKDVIDSLKESNDTFAGNKVFQVTPVEYNKCHLGRTKNERWKRKLNMDDVSRQDIRKYHHRNPEQSIIIQNERTGEMTYLVKRNKI